MARKRLTALCLVAVVLVMVMATPAFAAVGTFKGTWGSWGAGNGLFNGPSGVAVASSGDVYVADYFNDRIQYFDSVGTYKGQWGTTGPGNGQFSNPVAVAVASGGDVYVADASNNRIQYFDATGAYKGQWGTTGTVDGQFASPLGVACAPNGSVYVVESGNHRVQYFSAAGVYQGQWGANGNLDGQFNAPRGIGVASSGDVYVADYLNDRVQYFDATGTYRGQWGTTGSGNGQFSGPIGIAIAPSGDVYVVDNANFRVQSFDSAGTYKGQWGSFGVGTGEFSGSTNGVAVAPSGDVYVSEDVANRVQYFEGIPATPVSIDISIVPGDLAFNATLGVLDTGSVTITNNGVVPVTFGSLTVEAPFSLGAENVSGAELAAGASATVSTVGFSSAIAGTFHGTLSIPIVSPVLETRTVSLTGVAEAALPPAAVAHNDAATAYSREVIIQPLANDEVGVGTIASFTQGAHGAVRTVVAGSALGYTPATGYLGADSFTYTTSSGAVATVNVTVLPGLGAPGGVTTSRASTTSVEVQWSAPTNVASGVAGYNVKWRTSGSLTWDASPALGSGVRSYVVPGLAPGVAYEFAVSVFDTRDYAALSGLAGYTLPGSSLVVPPVVILGSGPARLAVEGILIDSVVTVDPSVGDTVPGVGSVSVSGNALTVATDQSFSGVIRFPVTVTDSFQSRTVIAQITVIPGPPRSVTFQVVSSTVSRIQWAGAANATGYAIYVSGRRVATANARTSSYRIRRLLGPAASVAVVSLGGDSTASTRVSGTYRRTVAVRIGTVSFGTNSAVLTTQAKASLRSVAGIVAAQRFTEVRVDSYTASGPRRTAAFRRRLTTTRVNVVKAYLVREFARRRVRVRIVVSAHSGANPAGRSSSVLNRRAEIAVR